jgi:hypothetical protein
VDIRNLADPRWKGGREGELGGSVRDGQRGCCVGVGEVVRVHPGNGMYQAGVARSPRRPHQRSKRGMSSDNAVRE